MAPREAACTRVGRLCPSGGAALRRGRFKLAREHNLRTDSRCAGAFPALSALASAPYKCISVNASPAAAGSSAGATERGLAWPIGAAAYASHFPPATADPAAKFSRPGPSRRGRRFPGLSAPAGPTARMSAWVSGKQAEQDE